MVVLLDNDIFEEGASEEEKRDLIFLIHLLIYYSDRYNVMFYDFPGDLKILENISPQDKAVLEGQYIKSVTENWKDDCKISKRGDDIEDKKIFSVKEAIIYLLQPVSVILENGLNDSYFLLALFRNFDSERKVERFYNEKWLRFENAGGCGNIENLIESMILFYQNKIKFLRCFVIVDSDKRYPTEVTHKYDHLIKYLNEKSVNYHILEKRNMENYLPVEDLMLDPQFNNWKNAFSYLEPPQKDHYNMSEGFLGELSNEEKKDIKSLFDKEKRGRMHEAKRAMAERIKEKLDKNIMDLFSNVSAGNFIHLMNGMGLGNFKSKYPEFFNNEIVNKRRMEQLVAHQNDPQELTKIVDKIKSIL